MRSFSTDNRLIEFIFYGNYFYGLCTVALCIESSLQQSLPLNTPLFYLLVFCTTVMYYTKAYTTDVSADAINKRTRWYALHRSTVKTSQWLMLLLTLGLGCGIFWTDYQNIFKADVWEWALLLLFPCVAGLYYGVNSRLFGRYSLRDKGWLKPFVIGFTWAGFVTVYPVLYYCMSRGLAYQPPNLSLFLFLKNFIFITILCIMFDIKDYASDYHQHVNTFVVKLGLRRTIFYVLLPITLLSLVTFVIFVLYEHLYPLRILLNTIPIILLFFVGYSMRLRRSTLYYLVVVDGMMLVKAAFGILAMLLSYSA